ncbi:hypothetical protein L210DRAFT_3757192 [Boletus edulis BED1]|uniref:F-box domain-containing protein n=1 Tax=Boletus edulis BED1 TaxID=1328754 RepID=A0AAD4GIF2_BOLED|nr:hypothetical protein L210DRAFT_3757192 [Boletus edulis BED1]
MHPALYVEEILLEIFGHCYDRAGHRMYYIYINKTDLPTLARTCKAFRDPALDILWAELYSLAPLIKCLPGASSQIVDNSTLYSLNRPLEQADWDIILKFSCRVRIFRLGNSFGVVSECIKELSKPPTSTVSIFPNLHDVLIEYPSGDTFPFLRHLPGPSLVVIKFAYVWDAIEIFREGCPNITTFDYDSVELDNDAISSLICQWSKLRSVDCPYVVPTIAALTHLSNMPHLRHLSVEVCDALVDRVQSTWPSPLTFPTLIQYHPRSLYWAPVSRFFDHLRLPVVEQVDVELACRPTEQEFKSFLATLPGTCNHQSLIDINIHTFERIAPSMPVPNLQYINFHHLYPLTVFVNLRAIRIQLRRGIDLSEQELLQLTLSWPRLEKFHVGRHNNETRGLSAITPGGFVQLLGQCRSLSHFSFPFNTHGYTEVYQGHPWHGLKMPDGAVIDVGVSPIEEDSIETLGIFFHAAPFPHFRLDDEWDYLEPIYFEEADELIELFNQRWERVRSLARRHWMERDNLLSALRNRGQHCG